jgi:hypothetical protein
MSNLFQVTQYVLDEVFIRYVNYLNFAKVANRNIEGDFKNLKYATGQTIDYRLEERFLGGQGATAQSEGLVQVIRPLTISQQFHSMVEFNGMELTFDRARDQPYLDMMLNPRAKRLANLVESFICNSFQTSIWNAVGTSGAGLTFATVTQADAYMTQLGIPEDGNRFFASDPMTLAALAVTQSTLFNGTVNRGALMDGFVAHLSGFDFFKTNFTTFQTAGVGGSGGSPPTGFTNGGTVTNGPISSGNTIVVTGISTSTGATVFNVGDIIEIANSAGVFAVNPLNYNPLTQRAQFVVTAPVIADGSGNATISVNPTIVVGGARANISAAIPNGAQIWLSNSFTRSLAFHNQAIVFAAPAIKELKGGVEAVTTYSDLYKMAMTYTLGADIRNYVQLDRLDIICGEANNPEFAVVVRS